MIFFMSNLTERKILRQLLASDKLLTVNRRVSSGGILAQR